MALANQCLDKVVSMSSNYSFVGSELFQLVLGVALDLESSVFVHMGHILDNGCAQE